MTQMQFHVCASRISHARLSSHQTKVVFAAHAPGLRRARPTLGRLSLSPPCKVPRRVGPADTTLALYSAGPPWMLC